MLFTEKFAPKKLGDFILPKRITDQYANGLYTHTLFHGNPGIGKSALAKLLASEFSFRYWNASLEGSIDILRTEIEDYCINVQLPADGKRTDYKVVILDEIDGVSPSFFNGLRGFMDQYSKKVRFIATCNYVSKIPDAISSRFDMVNFNFANAEEEASVKKRYEMRMRGVIEKAIKSTITDDAMKKLVDNHFPDFRKILQNIQRFHNSGITNITLEDVSRKEYAMKPLYDLILATGNINEPEAIHTLLMGEYATRASDVLQSLDTNFIDYIVEQKPDYKNIIPLALIRVCYYQSILHTVMDPALAMKACVFELLEAACKNRIVAKPQ
jgi:DNA polymerase III delta prime subunit